MTRLDQTAGTEVDEPGPRAAGRAFAVHHGWCALIVLHAHNARATIGAAPTILWT